MTKNELETKYIQRLAQYSLLLLLHFHPPQPDIQTAIIASFYVLN